MVSERRRYGTVIVSFDVYRQSATKEVRKQRLWISDLSVSTLIDQYIDPVEYTELPLTCMDSLLDRYSQ
jgi:hypothetical protein